MNWQANKEVHNSYWGKLFTEIKSKTDSFTDIEKEWASLNVFEFANRDYTYSFEGQQRTVPVPTYIERKANLLYSKISEIVDEDTDYLVDMGSGWGRNSISFHIRNPKQKMICSELSDSGRFVTEHFKKKYDLPFETLEFNWFDFTSLINLLKEKSPKKVAFFSFHSIEQADYLRTEDWKNLLALPIEMKGIHIEPINWQYDNKPFPFNNHYNRNFKQTFDSLEEGGILQVTNNDPDYYHFTNTMSGKQARLVEWVKL